MRGHHRINMHHYQSTTQGQTTSLQPKPFCSPWKNHDQAQMHSIPSLQGWLAQYLSMHIHARVAHPCISTAVTHLQRKIHEWRLGLVSGHIRRSWHSCTWLNVPSTQIILPHNCASHPSPARTEVSHIARVWSPRDIDQGSSGRPLAWELELRIVKGHTVHPLGMTPS